ncbi:kinase-like protein [Hypoxylon fragiforme]|uniref:kinase-like protein n=1 Tax=Hypoxylon fragiforme TaxID=63214 RepID=UPI0020C6DD02|nr:kinase-like protein [Hypoxylon fragiforme]KAI2612949.1 kinase-like protein [Hypoxylon fragiforme]
MAGRSRWADTEEDAALEAKNKREREEKKRLKLEKARIAAEEERRAQEKAKAEAEAEATRQRALQEEPQNQDGEQYDRPPAKRRKLTPERNEKGGGGETDNESNAKLLRFESGSWSKSRSVENYDKLNDIEEGSYGWVARAREIKTGKVVALKRLKLDSSDTTGLPDTGLREIQILKDCEHRNIVQLREVVVGDDTSSRIENVFLVLEFLEHDLMSILGDMPEPFLASEVKTLLLQLAAGVAYLHDNWILHRDLKTSNLLLNNRGQLKIADFGMARYVGDPAPPKLTQLVVTLWYRAPELLLGATTYGSAIDMWSVGCIFGELLAREPLLQGKTEVDELSKIFELCGIPTDESWPGFRRLSNARLLRLPKNTAANTGPVIRARFPTLTSAGSALLTSLLSLNPDQRPSAKDMLTHEFFRQDPKPKHEAMFPTFPSKAGQERRRKRSTPNAPGRGQKAADLGNVDFSGIFASREKEERGGGFALRMV